MGSLALRPDDSLAILTMALSIGFRNSVAFLSAIQATGLLTFAPVGLPPTEHASLHWTHLSARRVTNLYDLMDSAYDAQAIHEHSRSLGHVPIIDANPRRDRARKAELQEEEKRRRLLGHSPAEEMRYRERTTVERVNARLKDEFGGRMIRVRGNAKVMCHLMFGIVALTADQILRLIT